MIEVAQKWVDAKSLTHPDVRGNGYIRTGKRITQLCVVFLLWAHLIIGLNYV